MGKLVELKLNKTWKGGEQMDEVLSVLRTYDRMPGNLDFPEERVVKRVLELYGYLTLFVFVCPDTRSKFLNSDQKERFMPAGEPSRGLIFARIPKLKLLINALWRIGVPSKLVFAVADNSYELYRGPFEGIKLDPTLMDGRRELYAKSLRERLAKDFPQMMEIFSLGLNRIGLASEEITIPNEILNKEMAFQRQVVFSRYYSKEPPQERVLEQIVRGKCRAYAEQGLLIEAADAILIATEGTDEISSWIMRTRMLKLGGARFPVIYPYLRRETLK